jgi:Ca2+-binding RTX toxin-like protein
MTESSRPANADPGQSTEGDVILLAAVLDDTEDQNTALPPLAEQEGAIDPDGLPEPPIETTAGPGGTPPGSGGSSQYSSDFGNLITGLQASGDGEGSSGSATLQGFFPAAFTQDDSLVTLPAATPPAPTAFVFVPPANPVGPGADQPLFTKHADGVDLNAIDVGGYLDGTQYDAGKGHDTVILPTTAREALEVGFTPGSLFQAGNGNDTVTGGGLADLIDGGNGQDSLLGGNGKDSLFGGNGQDSLDGGAGNDLLDGGSSNDLLQGANGADSLIGGGGRDTLEGGAGSDLLYGDAGNDSLSGGTKGDSLFGGNGRDTLDGGSGNDLLDGGGGNDLLVGGFGNDTLIGGSNNDTLIGGSGNDTLTGGSGRDAFAYSLSTDEGDDLILDFKTGNGGDRLEISDLLDVNGDTVIDLADLDAGGHSVSGSADAIIITFDSGTSITLDGLNGLGIDSFADLVADAKVNVDIL